MSDEILPMETVGASRSLPPAQMTCFDKPNVAVIRQWITALRSGEYQQGMNRLRMGDKYCCLGVLCDVHRKLHEDCTWSEHEGLMRYSGDKTLLGSIDTLPSAVREWAGLRTHDGYGFGPDGEMLISLNDSGRQSFEQIADVIEKRLNEHLEKNPLRTIVAAAYRRDGRVYVGRRHSDVIKVMVEDFGLEPPIGREGDEDGFITHDGRFVDREEAYVIAKAAGQLKYHHPVWGDCLYSESVW